MFHTILVPVDGSKPSEKAVNLALQLALTQNGEVWFCHVPVLTSEIGMSAPSTRYVALQWDDAIRAGRAILDAARARADKLAVPCKTALGAGLPADGILEVAEHERVGVIVMGRGDFARGKRTRTTTEAVIDDAPVPVVVVGPGVVDSL
jgi:nucleotide-binding universal stress UspA family protein